MAIWHKYAAKRRYDHLRAGDKLDRSDRDFAGHREWDISGSVTRRRTWRSGERFYTVHSYGRQVWGQYDHDKGCIVAMGMTGG